MKRIGIFGTLAALVFCTGMAFGQASSGNLVGTVKDATGAVIPNASVTVTSESTHVATSVQANSDGQYRVDNMLPADYDLKVVAPGFQGYLLRGVTITPSKTSTEDATLGVATSTSVEVEANAGVTLDTTTNNLTTSFSAQALDVMPTSSFGNGVLNASLLAPNISSPGGAGVGTGPSIGGQRTRDNDYTVEGIDDNNKSVTGPIIEIPNDAVADFTLITNQFSPDFGHSAGGQFNTNVISGTNHFHGKIYEYFQNRNLNAENAPAGQKTPNTRFDQNRYGGQIGGPIVRDKLFFFVNYERFEQGLSLNEFLCTPTAGGIAALKANAAADGFSATNLNEYLALTPTANVNGGAQVTDANDNACFDQASGGQYLTVGDAAYVQANNGYPVVGPGTGLNQNIALGNAHLALPNFTNSDQITGSLDYTLSPRNSFRFRYSYLTEAAADTVPSLPQFATSVPVKEHLLAFSYFHNFTPNLINEFRLGYNRLFQNFPVSGPSFPGLSAFPNLTIYDADIDIGPDDNAPQFTIQNMYQVVDNVTYIKGRHTLKIGFDGRKFIAPSNFIQRQRGDYEWYDLTAYLDDLAPDYFGERSAGAVNYAGDQTAFYGYANDTWRATDRLTFNYGLRYEYTAVPVGERQQALNALASVPGLITFGEPQPQYTNFVPRIGVAFAATPKTSIRAGFGMAYDINFDNLGLLTSPPELSQTHDVGNTLAGDPDYLSPNFLANGGLSNKLVSITSPTVARAETAAYLPNTQVLPYSENYNFTIQQVFSKNYTAEIQYLGTRGVHLPTQNQTDVQNEVTPANQLVTYSQGPTLDPTGTFATIATGSTANTLAAIKTQAGACGYIIPAFCNAGFQSKITSYAPFGGSNYNGLGLNITRRYINGLQLNASYTFSKDMDDSTAEVNASDLTQRRPENERNQHAEYALSALSRKHRVTMEAVYDLPYFKHSNFLLRNTLGNWQLSPIYTYESPEFVTPSSEINSNLDGDSGAISRTIINGTATNKNTGSGIVPVYSTNTTLTALCGAPATTCNGNLVGYLETTPSAYYYTAGSGTLPTASRNTLAGRPINNIDLTAGKKISITERYSFEFQAQAFNLFNHAQYIPGDLDGINSTSTAGAATNYLKASSTVFAQAPIEYAAHARGMQLVAKFNF